MTYLYSKDVRTIAMLEFLIGNLSQEPIAVIEDPNRISLCSDDMLIVHLVTTMDYKITSKLLTQKQRYSIVAWVDEENNELLAEFIRWGINGVVYSSENMLEAIRIFKALIYNRKELMVSNRFITTFLKQMRIKEFVNLTPREYELLKMLKLGMNSVEIADLLYVSKTTIRTHVKNIYEKLGVNTRSHAVSKAMDLRLL